jgi:hypothetical protein
MKHVCKCHPTQITHSSNLWSWDLPLAVQESGSSVRYFQKWIGTIAPLGECAMKLDLWDRKSSQLCIEQLERTLDLEKAICFNFRRDNVVRGSENICQV